MPLLLQLLPATYSFSLLPSARTNALVTEHVALTRRATALLHTLAVTALKVRTAQLAVQAIAMRADLYSCCDVVSCPTSITWVAKGNATTLHAYVKECGNAGFCDRSTGECECLPGFSGQACKRRTLGTAVLHGAAHSHPQPTLVMSGWCPNYCSFKGTCESFERIAATEASGTATAATGVTAHGVTYTNWEAASLFMCKCDFGTYSGDCSARESCRGELGCVAAYSQLTFPSVLPSWR